jgi:methylation protein EvaC
MKKLQQGEYIHHTTCRFCQGANLVKILDFGDVPLAGGFLKEEQFAEEKFYPLQLHFCRQCSLVQVTNAVCPDALFKNYFYFSSSIKTLVDHFAHFARDVNERFLKNLRRPFVFELGCNDGVLLKPLAALGAKAVGVDPATNVVKSINSPEITVINAFFSEKLANQVRNEYGPADAFLSSYSFAHIDDMVDVMKGVKSLLKPDGLFIFEVYYLGTLIDELQYDMIYHEHFSYYSIHALDFFLRRFGMEIFDVKLIPGVRAGAARFYAKNVGQRSEASSRAVMEMLRYEKGRGFDKAETFLDYADKVNATRRHLLDLLDKIKREGKTIIGYGASGRGTTIMNYCGIDQRYLDYVVDDAPAKHGFHTPGTHVPIKPWSATESSPWPNYALLFAWSFIDEVKKKRKDYLDRGGHFIVPLPEVKVISE